MRLKISTFSCSSLCSCLGAWWRREYVRFWGWSAQPRRRVVTCLLCRCLELPYPLICTNGVAQYCSHWFGSPPIQVLCYIIHLSGVQMVWEFKYGIHINQVVRTPRYPSAECSLFGFSNEFLNSFFKVASISNRGIQWLMSLGLGKLSLFIQTSCSFILLRTKNWTQ